MRRGGCPALAGHVLSLFFERKLCRCFLFFSFCKVVRMSFLVVYDHRLHQDLGHGVWRLWLRQSEYLCEQGVPPVDGGG